MQFQITGKQIDIGSALQTQVETQLSDVVDKYAGRPTDSNVVFSKEGHLFVCETTVHLSTGLTVQARGKAGEIYAALDASAEKMDKQLRRYKRRLKDHQKERVNPVELTDAPAYILASQDDSQDEPDSAPVIVAEMETKIPTISVSEAVMQMELTDAGLQVFRNEKHGGVNVVYRREDGNIGWIDPRNLN